MEGVEKEKQPGLIENKRGSEGGGAGTGRGIVTFFGIRVITTATKSKTRKDDEQKKYLI